jgi:ABC-2 type transport system permease protein
MNGKLQEAALSLHVVRAGFVQQWTESVRPANVAFAFLSAVGPASVIAWIARSSDNDAVLPYIIVGAALMAMWRSTVLSVGFSLLAEQMRGTLDLLMGTRTPMALVMFSKAMAIMASTTLTGLSVTVVVLLIAERTPAISRDVFFVFSAVLAIVSVVAMSFIFAPFGFLVGGRAGFLNAVMALGPLAGLVYPVTLLPLPFEILARCVPSSWAMEAVVRSADGASTGRIAIDWAAAILTGAVYLGVTLLLFQMAERRVRISGVLSRF